MKFTALGASGPTGLELVKECLEKGHQVTALVRNPDKITVKHENLTVVKVNIMKEEELTPHVKGSDAVLSCLGTHCGIFTPCSFYTDTIKSITGAMRNSGVSRFIGMSSWGSKDDPGLPYVIRWLLRPVILRTILPNMAEMEDYLTDNCKDLEYTVVRMPGLSNAESSGKEFATAEGNFVPGAIFVPYHIPRRDAGKFMLMCAVDGQWKKTCVAIEMKN